MPLFRRAATPAPPTEGETEKKEAPARRTSSEPPPMADSKKGNKFDDDDDDDDFFGKAKTTTTRKGQKSKAELDNMSTQELENYAVDQAEETTKSVQNCLKIAEDIREDANKTLDTLHAQGDQIHRTHEKTAEMEKELSRGEKILGSLGGMFSMTWKPTKGKEIKGPEPRDNDHHGKGKEKGSKEDREKLGLEHGHKGKKGSKTAHGDPKDAMQKVEMEKEKQDDALDDLSSVLGDLKGMANDMGSELDRQNKALDNLSEDVDELNNRVKGANNRARKLVAK
ncbi:putative target SNARE coiled-coil domain-containing protein [Helianthus annuus]|uniref:Putative target SNARE coiled-coil-like domain-containing protein n=1 Tax=Helianthus annuus TaxID=4232 RepID=A0A251T1F5_HELAN|nr:putative SNAP25 homologous protein SNAP30 [Helianthus annuus]KAF5777171.1 putative target SNARE coiled-coil domain-containing protein [Helianthus annuus]KAJ0488763.1 putative target SNARE coiled-coil domain-containing protein [Helianthus annuus]KAJ0504600.1 putative target SNARE coiled-coil domain-containing protein [Helianthus annuus]KAJ0674325.1 putative target SNARE coiled-coil domain-containing protein [Helianthus annuus]KAJ0677711.1 putative target SNARE coiled-coil domain-containing p